MWCNYIYAFRLLIVSGPLKVLVSNKVAKDLSVYFLVKLNCDVDKLIQISANLTSYLHELIQLYY
jgi:hypothetical protein